MAVAYFGGDRNRLADLLRIRSRRWRGWASGGSGGSGGMGGYGGSGYNSSYYTSDTGTTATAVSPIVIDRWQWGNDASTTNGGGGTALQVRIQNEFAQQQMQEMAWQLRDYGREVFRQAAPAVIRRTREDEERAREAEKARRVAAKRAEGLLLSHLDPAQRDQYLKNNWFIVKGGKSGKRYRITGNGSLSGNVHELDRGGKIVARYCGHAANHVMPKCDHLLNQKIRIELDEETFFKRSNRWAGSAGLADVRLAA